jgi:hypothetical protein
MRRQIRDTDSGQIRTLLETKNNRELMKNFLLGLSAVVAVSLPLSQNAEASEIFLRHREVFLVEANKNTSRMRDMEIVRPHCL